MNAWGFIIGSLYIGQILATSTDAFSFPDPTADDSAQSSDTRVSLLGRMNDMNLVSGYSPKFRHVTRSIANLRIRGQVIGSGCFGKMRPGRREWSVNETSHL